MYMVPFIMKEASLGVGVEEGVKVKGVKDPRFEKGKDDVFEGMLCHVNMMQIGFAKRLLM